MKYYPLISILFTALSLLTHCAYAQNATGSPPLALIKPPSDTNSNGTGVGQRAFPRRQLDPRTEHCEECKCGNGVLDPGEECDDGNNVDGDGCSSTCKKECKCGNGILDPGEECDDGNTIDGDGCSSTCKKECKCGNGILDPGEECDDGNTIDGDGCSSTCKKECKCGNGVLDPGEECDDGNTIDGDGCSSTCKKECKCGNGVLDPGEECDDGNTFDGDGCSSTCKKEVCDICASCNPTPGLNFCDITTSCIITEPSGQTQCACRAGYKASSPNEPQWRLPFPGQEYRVFVAPGVPCDTLCDHPYGAPSDICNEVAVVDKCHP